MFPGEIYWVDLPNQRGHEQSGRRPCVVLQNDIYAGQSPLVMVIPLTTQSSVRRFPAVMPVPATPRNGLPSLSFALVFQFRATDRSRIQGYLGELESNILDGI